MKGGKAMNESGVFGVSDVFISVDGGEPFKLNAETVKIEAVEQPEKVEPLTSYSGTITLAGNVETPFRTLSDRMRRYFKAITWNGKIYW